MNNAEQKVQRYHALKPLRYDVLVQVELCSELPPATDPPELTLYMRLQETSARAPRQLCLTFQGVADLKLKELGGMMQMTQLDITRIHSWQWEGLDYHVTDAEEGTISFYCRDFQAEVVELQGEGDEGAGKCRERASLRALWRACRSRMIGLPRSNEDKNG